MRGKMVIDYLVYNECMKKLLHRFICFIRRRHAYQLIPVATDDIYSSGYLLCRYCGKATADPVPPNDSPVGTIWITQSSGIVYECLNIFSSGMPEWKIVKRV
jgi:hypothetical protein